MAACHSIPLPARSLDRFANWLYARRGLASSTVDLIIGYIRRLQPQIGLNPSHEDIERCIANMRRRGGSYGNVSNAIKALMHYMDFLGRPIELQRPKKPQGMPIKTLSEGKIAVLIDSAKDLREQAMLALLAYSGIRNSELTTLRVRDIDFGEESITIEHGKGSRSRTVYVPGACLEILSEYLQARQGKPDELLFITVRHRRQLEPQSIRKIVRQAAARAGIKRRVWPHLLRHSLANALLDRGANIFTIQAQLGHAHVSTTVQCYLHPSRRTMRADYFRSAPSYL